ncbi:MAG TPA: C45 family peptidase [Nocardioidaceae bacterium]|nr:C45 family peptidase [Nocardioidaceae bacterium]
MGNVRTFTSSVLDGYDRGVEFGRRHREEVRRTVAAYHRLFLTRAVGDFDVRAWSDRARETIDRVAPEAAEEIRGIAHGADVEVHEIAAVNARTELLAVANPTGVVSECSTVVALPPGRPPVAVQTWDWYAAMAGNWLHWRIPRPDGRVVETVTEYGVLGKIGVNSDGVGVLFNMLHHANDEGAAEDGIGYPVHLLSRRILDTARDLDQALGTAGSVRTSASTSLTLVEGREDGGRTVSVELFPGGPGELDAEDGLLVRTNHFVSGKGRPGCLAAGIGPGTEIRRATLLEAFADRLPEDPGTVVAAMRDHREVGGVCAHPDRSMDPVLWHATLATVAVDTRAGRLEVRAGGPCLRPSWRT